MLRRQQEDEAAGPYEGDEEERAAVAEGMSSAHYTIAARSAVSPRGEGAVRGCSRNGVAVPALTALYELLTV